MATAVPAFAVEAVVVPSALTAFIPGDVWGIFHHTNSFTVRQHVKPFPKWCCGCPPCAKQENSYSIYAGLTQGAEAEVLRVDEVSNDWNRCCCTPYHPLKLEVRQFIPRGVGGTDASNIWDDLHRSGASMSATRTRIHEQQLMDREQYMTNPVLMTAQRTDGQRCIAFPCKWLSTVVCFNCCQDGINLYAGAITDEANNDLGRPPRDQTNKANIAERLIGSAIQPNYGGYCTPTIHLSTPKDPQPFGKIQGPCFFGGWSEVCCNFKFYVSRFDSRHREGDLGVIIKKKPSSFGGLIREVLTDADVYSIEFNPEAGLDSSEKATILAGQLLADYMLFDGNTEKCKDTDSAVICYCCFYSFFGQICPVYIAIPKGG